MKEIVKNVPNYAWSDENKYWVVSECDDEFWFYGAYETSNRANEVALSLGKIVIDE